MVPAAVSPPHYRQAFRHLQEFVDKSRADFDVSRSFFLIFNKLVRFDTYSALFPAAKTKA